MSLGQVVPAQSEWLVFVFDKWLSCTAAGKPLNLSHACAYSFIISFVWCQKRQSFSFETMHLNRDAFHKLEKVVPYFRGL